jgi:excisionase family DNA binding protein
MAKTTRELESPLLTLREASRLLRVSRNTLRRWSEDGLIASYRIGDRGDRRFEREELEAFIEARCR